MMQIKSLHGTTLEELQAEVKAKLFDKSKKYNSYHFHGGLKPIGQCFSSFMETSSKMSSKTAHSSSPIKDENYEISHSFSKNNSWFSICKTNEKKVLKQIEASNVTDKEKLEHVFSYENYIQMAADELRVKCSKILTDSNGNDNIQLKKLITWIDIFKQHLREDHKLLAEIQKAFNEEIQNDDHAVICGDC